MSDSAPLDPPSPFIEQWITELSRSSRAARSPTPWRRTGRALDVATGRGRHLEVLARSGYRAFGVDWKVDVAVSARARAASADVTMSPLVWVADLTMHPLPRDFFDLVLV